MFLFSLQLLLNLILFAFQSLSSIQLELNCCPQYPPSTNAAVVWNYQRQFGIACRSVEKLWCCTFGFVLFATVSYTFIGFVNASYNLLKSKILPEFPAGIGWRGRSLLLPWSLSISLAVADLSHGRCDPLQGLVPPSSPAQHSERPLFLPGLCR